MAEKGTQQNKTSEIIINLYQNRFKQLSLGQECYKRGDISKSIEHYSNYLHILAQYFDTRESDLQPSLFDLKKDVGEILLISNVYWNLAKIYDKNPNSQNQSIHFLEQFLKFTKGQKHQHANTRILKNYINSGKPKNSKEFKRIYETIKTKSSPCFISTYCFGHDAFITNQLRLLKNDISGNLLGNTAVKLYYRYAPSAINLLENHLVLKSILLPIIKKILFIIAQTHRKLSLKK